MLNTKEKKTLKPKQNKSGKSGGQKSGKVSGGGGTNYAPRYNKTPGK